MSQLLQPQQLHDYQKECVIHQLQHPDSMLWLTMGLGKTVITLTTIVDRMRAGQVQKTLVFGPLRVIQSVWHKEAAKWEHTKHLSFSVVHGNKDKRTRALFMNADIFLINYENMNWLTQTLDHYYTSQGKELPFQMVVYDEVSKLKNSTSLRVAGGKRDRKDRNGRSYPIKIMGWRKMIDRFQFRTGLTGTPASNGYLDLHGQYLAVDGGKRLGEYITHYKDSYFVSDYNGWKYTPTELGKQWIEHKISDITKRMESKDYLDMPVVKVTNMMIDLPDKARTHYENIENQLFTSLDNGKEIELFAKQAISNKCLQICNGAPYLNSKSSEWEAIHDAKLDALAEVLEEAGGSPVLCSYTFKSDAERIMRRFKKHRPVNLTATPSAKTGAVIDRWNNGEIGLLVGHPACLHPSTLVLTERRGWIKIIDVRTDDRVFDGIEFVNHDGCSYSGYREVIDVFGVIMTPGHKLLINGEWVEAQNVGNSEQVRREALYQYKGDDPYLGEMFTLQHGVQDHSPERGEAQPIKKNSLPTLHSGSVPQYDWNSDMENLVRDESKSYQPFGQKLRRQGNFIMQRVVRVRELLQRYVTRVFRQPHNRACGCEQTLQQGQLYMDNDVQPTGQQTAYSQGGISGGGNTSSRTMSPEWVQQDDVNESIESGYDWRPSGCRRIDLTIRQEPKSEKYIKKRKEEVYDLVNCGPRNRFLIRNHEGDVFVSHNSMGHGIDGLQLSGSIIVWYGVTWNLEHYEQMNGRLDRQGQKNSVSIIRILCKDSIDLAVADAINRKIDDQAGLKDAVDRYRRGEITNDMKLSFL